MIQGGKTAIYKWLEYHQEIFACLNGKSKVDDKEIEEKNDSNAQEMHSIREQSQTILQTVSKYTVAQDLVTQEHPATPDLSPHKQSTFKDLKMLVSNIESSLASCQKHFQSEIGKINQSLINLVNTETLEDKLRQIESKHKLEVTLLKERVSQLELENYNLKEQVTTFTNFQKGCNKRMGRAELNKKRVKGRILTVCQVLKTLMSIVPILIMPESLSMAMPGRKLIRMGVCLYMLQQLFQ